jgi:hypothetical protein
MNEDFTPPPGFEDSDYEPAPARSFSVTMRLANGSVLKEMVYREEHMTTELFNSLVAAIARKFDGTVQDIKEIFA